MTNTEKYGLGTIFKGLWEFFGALVMYDYKIM